MNPSPPHLKSGSLFRIEVWIEYSVFLYFRKIHVGMGCCIYHKWKSFACLIIAAVISSLIMILYMCPQQSCNMLPSPRRRIYMRQGSNNTQKYGWIADRLSTPQVQAFPFDMNGEDVFVFLHMQKTGGTVFGKRLMKHIEGYPCDCPRRQKRCACSRPKSNKQWIFSRYSLGWPCGLHADWTELQNCVPEYMNKREGQNPQRRFLYITIIREPVSRFLSEYLCFQRGTTWSASVHMCNGRKPTLEELPPCYSGEDWADVTLPQFLDCSSNLARNRQVRMLADLTLVNCYNTTGMSPKERDKKMLESAKRNLRSMAFFAIVEYQEESQFLFEQTFGLRFSLKFEQHNQTRASDAMAYVDDTNLPVIKQQNSLDLELYAYAKELFMKRVNFFKQENVEVTKQSAYKQPGQA